MKLFQNNSVPEDIRDIRMDLQEDLELQSQESSVLPNFSQMDYHLRILVNPYQYLDFPESFGY